MLSTIAAIANELEMQPTKIEYKTSIEKVILVVSPSRQANQACIDRYQLLLSAATWKCTGWQYNRYTTCGKTIVQPRELSLAYPRRAWPSVSRTPYWSQLTAM